MYYFLGKVFEKQIKTIEDQKKKNKKKKLKLLNPVEHREKPNQNRLQDFFQKN